MWFFLLHYLNSIKPFSRINQINFHVYYFFSLRRFINNNTKMGKVNKNDSVKGVKKIKKGGHSLNPGKKLD